MSETKIRKICLILFSLVSLVFLQNQIFALSDTLTQRLNNYCKNKRLAYEITNIINRAKKKELNINRFKNRIYEGILKNVPCAKLLKAINREYQFQNSAVFLLKQNGLENRKYINLITDFLFIGIPKFGISVLLKEFKKNKNILYLARAGNFLVKMRRYGWTVKDTISISVYIIKKNITKSNIEVITRLLNYGIELRIKKKVVVAVIKKGLENGISFYKIKLNIREKRPF